MFEISLSLYYIKLPFSSFFAAIVAQKNVELIVCSTLLNLFYVRIDLCLFDYLEFLSLMFGITPAL